jgi:hypothetical protein
MDKDGEAVVDSGDILGDVFLTLSPLFSPSLNLPTLSLPRSPLYKYTRDKLPSLRRVPLF